MRIRRRLPELPILACLFALASISISGAAFADTITLKSAARQRGDSRVVTLSDIATLEGEEALRLADVQITSIKPGGKPVEITVAEVRRALDAATANWAKINLSGRSVLIRPARDAGTPPPQAMAPTTLDGAQSAPRADNEHHITLDTIIAEQTIRGAIANLIITNWRVEPRAVRIRTSDNDAGLLSTGMHTGRFEIQPMCSLAGDRLVFTVRSWDGDASAPVGQISLTVERQTRVVRARRDIVRDGVVAEDDVEPAMEWLAPSEAAHVAPRAAVVGRNLTRSINAGEVIRTRDLERSTLIKRGDLVTVRCLVGGVSIALQAEARADGAEGETIEFRKTGEREAFLATVTAKNEAVVDLSRR